ncbi:hypothetical protein [Alteraurantiacibacter buctensis]|uniref:Uncharacterized protein n=1 Tax=Alteraurantiacibacter buctensis TaxID=1503981 RepID=A0A844Z053_9SPHN|nr:hypothetical protein [Alteraurantiacibacter buctensis]MXO72381.1 hypothetical protein [Alteraurantiacibacter buctensis]
MTYHLESWEQRKRAALQILANDHRLTRKSGSFLGQCVADPTPLSDKQIDWFLTLAERSGVAVEA